MNFSCFLLLISLLFPSKYLLTADHDWNYLIEGGFASWCHEESKCCGNHQSPINFDLRAVIPENLESLNLNEYYVRPKWMNLKNNGHGVYIDLGYSNAMPSVSGGGFQDEYEFLNFHFHWGSDNEQGSEHTVNGFAYPLELHIVHFNKKYGNINTALEHQDGLIVLGVFYELDESDNPHLEEVTKHMLEIQFSGEKANVSDVKFTLREFLPSDIESFFRYYGSLTTPGCDEVVMWTVFEKPQTISSRQLQIFRKMKANKRGPIETPIPMWDNFRPPQHLHGRKIKRRVPPGDSGTSYTLQLPLLLVSAFVSALRNQFL